MENFFIPGIPHSLQQTLKHIKFITPTEIQAKAIPVALEGKDIIGLAQTGTGKTGAFLIPIISKLLTNPNSCSLILAPTRELALQVKKVIDQMLNRERSIKSVLVIGGASISTQIQQLKAKPRIIVGTPGRINDHLNRKSINLKFVDTFVLDEFDRMLEIGFSDQLNRIVSCLSKRRQTLMFSATMTPEVKKLSKEYMDNPVSISVGTSNAVAPKIDQKVLRIKENQKYDNLIRELSEREGAVIIFANTQQGVERLAKNLITKNFNAAMLHGGLPHRKRESVIKKFRAKDFHIMVATDIAARGLDIQHVQHVINYDLPRNNEDYIHRIGRTARAGASGNALSFILPKEDKKWSAIKRLSENKAA